MSVAHTQVASQRVIVSPEQLHLVSDSVESAELQLQRRVPSTRFLNTRHSPRGHQPRYVPLHATDDSSWDRSGSAV